MTRSIRTSLVLGTTLVTLIVLATAGLWMYVTVRTSLVRQFDAGLRREAAVLASMTDVYPTRFKLDLEPFRYLELFSASSDTYFEIWLDSTLVAYRSPSLAGRDLARFDGPPDVALFRWLDVGDAERVRAAGLEFMPRVEDVEDEEAPESPDATKPSTKLPSDYRGRPATLVFARRTDAIDAFLRRLRDLLLILGLGASAVAMTVLWLIIRSNLSPLDALAKEIAGLRTNDVSSRVVLPRLPPEIEPVVARLNELLERIEGAMLRERSFSSHVAHELRTPVAALRSTLEVVRSRPRSAADWDAATGECLTIVQQMQEMVESLLDLFRIEAGHVEQGRESLDLCDAARDGWTRFEAAARARRLRTELDLPSRTLVATNPGLLRIAIRNLFENAVLHADEGGFVHIAVATHDGCATLHVRNSGSRVAPADVQRVFDRFWRGDEARSSSGAHIGLGLSLVKRVAVVLGGTVDATSSGGVFDVALSLRTDSRPA